MPAVHSLTTVKQIENLSLGTLKTRLRTHNLEDKDRKAELTERFLVSYVGEAAAGAEGHSAMLQNTPPAHLDTVTFSSAGVAGHEDGEPTMVSMIDDMSDVAGTVTPGPVEYLTIGGEECILLGVDVSAPPTGEGVTGEDDVQHGEVSTHTESNSVAAGEFPPQEQGVTGEKDVQHCEVSTHTERNSAAAGEFPPQQQPSSPVVVRVTPINLVALSFPLSVQPATPGRSPSSADQSQVGDEELAADKLVGEMVESFMENSNATTTTISTVEGRVQIIEQVADKNHRRVGAIDNTVTQIDKRVEELKHVMGSRVRAEEDLQEVQETLRNHVETDSTNLATFKKELPDREEEVVKKHMDTLHQNCMNPAGRELQMRDIDSKFRHEQEKIRNNENDGRTKFQVEIERNLETKLGKLSIVF